MFLAEIVRRLAGSRTWYVPVPLDDVAGGGEQDILDAAKRQFEVILHDASINPSLVEALWRSLTRARRLVIVIDDVDRVGPGLSSYERAVVVARLISSAQRLDVPLLATAGLGSVESVAGSVIELAPSGPEFVRDRIEQAHGIPAQLKGMVLPALTGPLATPAMVDRVIVLMRREQERLTAALRAAARGIADLVLWRELLAACQVPGGVLTPEALEIIAYVLLMTGQRGVCGRAGSGDRRGCAGPGPGLGGTAGCAGPAGDADRADRRAVVRSAVPRRGDPGSGRSPGLPVVVCGPAVPPRAGGLPGVLRRARASVEVRAGVRHCLAGVPRPGAAAVPAAVS